MITKKQKGLWMYRAQDLYGFVLAEAYDTARLMEKLENEFGTFRKVGRDRYKFRDPDAREKFDDFIVKRVFFKGWE